MTFCAKKKEGGGKKSDRISEKEERWGGTNDLYLPKDEGMFCGEGGRRAEPEKRAVFW